jgi:hypothetical protein
MALTEDDFKQIGEYVKGNLPLWLEELRMDRTAGAGIHAGIPAGERAERERRREPEQAEWQARLERDRAEWARKREEDDRRFQERQAEWEARLERDRAEWARKREEDDRRFQERQAEWQARLERDRAEWLTRSRFQMFYMAVVIGTCALVIVLSNVWGGG